MRLLHFLGSLQLEAGRFLTDTISTLRLGLPPTCNSASLQGTSQPLMP